MNPSAPKTEPPPSTQLRKAVLGVALKIRPLLLPACALAAALLASFFPNQSANAAGVDFVHVTDFYHPHADPDDHFDAATVFALHQRGALSLRAVCLDAPYNSVLNGTDKLGIGDPAVMALAQLQVMTGASVPFAVGCPRRLTKTGDTQPEATPGDLAAANLILATLREARAPVVISICGGNRDMAIALAREPELFRKRCRAIYISAGRTHGEDSPKECNVHIDPLGAATVFNTAPGPVYWLPAFDAWKGPDEGTGRDDIAWGGPHDSLYRVEQKPVFDVVSPRLKNYFAFALRSGQFAAERQPPELNWWRYLNGAPDQALLAEHGAKRRAMWTTAAYLHAAGLTVEEDGRIVPRAEAKSPVFDFAPITIKADGQCRISWQPAPEGKSRFILTKSSAEAYCRAMPLALVSLLKELR